MEDALNDAIYNMTYINYSKKELIESLLPGHAGVDYSQEAAEYAANHCQVNFYEIAYQRAVDCNLEIDKSEDQTREYLTKSGFTSKEVDYALHEYYHTDNSLINHSREKRFFS